MRKSTYFNDRLIILFSNWHNSPMSAANYSRAAKNLKKRIFIPNDYVDDPKFFPNLYLENYKFNQNCLKKKEPKLAEEDKKIELKNKFEGRRNLSTGQYTEISQIGNWLDLDIYFEQWASRLKPHTNKDRSGFDSILLDQNTSNLYFCESKSSFFDETKDEFQAFLKAIETNNMLDDKKENKRWGRMVQLRYSKSLFSAKFLESYPNIQPNLESKLTYINNQFSCLESKFVDIVLPYQILFITTLKRNRTLKEIEDKFKKRLEKSQSKPWLFIKEKLEKNQITQMIIFISIIEDSEIEEILNDSEEMGYSYDWWNKID